jgi:hypothetical protein
MSPRLITEEEFFDKSKKSKIKVKNYFLKNFIKI